MKVEKITDKKRSAKGGARGRGVRASGARAARGGYGFTLWLLGYCVLRLPRSELESFLNLCLRYGFAYGGMETLHSENAVLVRVPMATAQRVLCACRAWQIRARAVARGGLPHTAMGYLKRGGLVVGLVLSVLLFVLAQSVVWRIDIVGNESLTDAAVLESLESAGLKIGARLGKLQTDIIEQRVMIKDDRIAWISVNLLGTVASVEVRESALAPSKDISGNPANLVALYDGEVVGVEIFSGFSAVSVGTQVKRGELLVSGIYKSERAPMRYTRASGKVFALVVRSFEVEIPLTELQKVPSGDKIAKKTLIFFGNSIKLFSNYRNLPASCDIINYLYTLDPFSLGSLPIAISVDEYLPYEMREVQLDEAEAIDRAYRALRELIDEQLPEAQILKKSLSGELVDGKYVLRCDVSAVCNIAKQVEFEIVS